VAELASSESRVASGELLLATRHSPLATRFLTTRNSQLATHYSLLTTRCWRDKGRDTTDASVGMLAGGLPASARMACGSNRVGGRRQKPIGTTTHGAIHA